MKTENNRLCIYPKDIQRSKGKSYRQSVRLLQRIRKELKKLENEFVTVEEFSVFAGLKLEQVLPLIIS